MKTLRFGGVMLLTLLLTAVLIPTTAADHHEGDDAAAHHWSVDATHSGVHFSVRHFFTQVPGRFDDFEGTIVYDPEDVSKSSVEFVVQADSVDTANENRDQHLRNEDFFDVEKYPTLSFKSTKVEGGGGDELSVTGDFTMHGVTKSITIPVQFLGSMETPMGPRAGFSTEFTVDRKDYGIEWNRALDNGGAILGDEVTIDINVEATQPKKEG